MAFFHGEVISEGCTKLGKEREKRKCTSGRSKVSVKTEVGEGIAAFKEIKGVLCDESERQDRQCPLRTLLFHP